MEIKKIAFIGLGVMGRPMALRLAKAGHELAVYDINPQAMAEFKSFTNCRLANSPADAAQNAGYVLTMLPDSDFIDEALFGTNGAAASMPKNALLIEMSTGNATRFMKTVERLKALGLRAIDAPMGRTPADAEKGDLLVLVGADEAILNEVKPLLENFGKDIMHIGPVGNAIKLKLINNYMSMVSMVLTAETLMFAGKLGLDRNTTVKVLQNTVAGRGQINVNFPKKVLAGDITPDFPLSLGLKDISLAIELAKSEGVPLFLGGVSRELFSLAKPWGRAQQDCTAMLLLLEDICNTPASSK